MENAKLIEVVKAAQAGNEKALEKLYLEHSKPVYYLALKLMKNKEDAEDITQEVFIYVFQKISELQNPEAFTAWLNRITANKCTYILRKKSKPVDIDVENLLEMDFTEESDPLLIPDKSLDNIETARMILEIIDNLPLPQRICIYYYYYEHLTVAQIAENLDANESTVRTRLAVARDKIRKELERLNDEEGIKLYSFAPLMLTPILKMSLQDFEMPAELTSTLLAKITAKAATAAEAASVGTASVIKSTAVMGIKAKIALAVAGVVIAGGITAGVILSGNSLNENIPVDVNISKNDNIVTANNEHIIGNGDEIEFTPASDPNQRGNLAGNRYAAIQGEWDYFIGQTKGQYFLFKERNDDSDDTERTLLYFEENWSIDWLNVVNDYIYFTTKEQVNPWMSGIYRIRTDGTGGEMLISSQDGAGFLECVVVGDWIYYTRHDDGIGYYLYKMRTDGTEVKKLTESQTTSEMSVSEDGLWIYHNNREDKNLYKTNIQGTVTVFETEERRNGLVEVGGWLYYSVKNDEDVMCLYRERSFEGDKELLHSKADMPGVYRFIIDSAGEWLYYYNPEDFYNLYRMKTDGTENQMLSEGGADICVVGDWVYYNNNARGLFKVRTDGTEEQLVMERDIFISGDIDLQYILELD